MKSGWTMLARYAGILAAAIIGVAGWFLGVEASRVPSVPARITSINDVEVWMVNGSDPVMFTWMLLPSDTVVLVVEAMPTEPANGGEYVVILRCDARLQSVQVHGGEADIATYGTGQCDDSMETVEQVITVSLAPDEAVGLSGRPVGPWTRTAAGKRAGQSPAIDADPAWRDIEGYDRGALVAPDRRSEVAAILFGAPTEILESFLPTDVDGGRVEVLTETMFFISDPLGPAIGWALERGDTPTDDEQSGLQPASARWSDPQGQAQAQRLILLSGVLLGVAATLTVESLTRLGRPQTPDRFGL